MDNKPLPSLISEFIHSTPAEIVTEVVNGLYEQDGKSPDALRRQLGSSIHNPQTKDLISKIIDCWAANNNNLNLSGLAVCIQTSLETIQSIHDPKLELIWTGPETVSPNFRRTDQALLDLILSAREDLLIVSFAVYKAPVIFDAIEGAIRRGVNLTLCLEDSDESIGKVTYSGKNAFSSSIFRMASFYTWPFENRPRSYDGHYGVLHAKVAIADWKRIFISSANLTGYAMDLNMELGVFIDDEFISRKVYSLFDEMIIGGTLLRK